MIRRIINNEKLIINPDSYRDGRTFIKMILLIIICQFSIVNSIYSQNYPPDTAVARELSCSSYYDSIQERDIYTFTEKKAVFPGGDRELFKFIQQNLVYPTIECNEHFGTIYVCFIVEMDGKVTYKAIRKSLCPALDQAALNVVEKMPPWIPAMCDGIAVPVIFTIPVKINLK